MDRGSFLGVLLGVLLLAVAIGLGPNPRIFFHPASTVVVVGGVIAATMIRFPLKSTSTYARSGCTATAKLAASVHGVVVQISRYRSAPSTSG